MGFRIGDASGPAAYRLQGAAGVSLTPASSISFGGAAFLHAGTEIQLTPEGSFAATVNPPPINANINRRQRRYSAALLGEGTEYK